MRALQIMKGTLLVLSALLALSSSQAQRVADADPVAINVARLQGTFDNGDQAGKPAAGAGEPVPHVTVTIEPTPQKDFALWHVHLQTDPQSTFDQTWAMQMRVEHDGSGALIPYYQLKQDTPPAAASFDPHGWLSLEACSLRGDFSKAHLSGMAEGEPCVAVSMSVGARRALLPVGFDYQGGTLQLDLNLRGVRTRIVTKRQH